MVLDKTEINSIVLINIWGMVYIKIVAARERIMVMIIITYWWPGTSEKVKQRWISKCRERLDEKVKVGSNPKKATSEILLSYELIKRSDSVWEGCWEFDQRIEKSW